MKDQNGWIQQFTDPIQRLRCEYALEVNAKEYAILSPPFEEWLMARATSIERERCLEIVEYHATQISANGNIFKNPICDSIAAEIRGAERIKEQGR